MFVVLGIQYAMRMSHIVMWPAPLYSIFPQHKTYTTARHIFFSGGFEPTVLASRVAIDLNLNYQQQFPCNENQLVLLFIISLFLQKTSTTK